MSLTTLRLLAPWLLWLPLTFSSAQGGQPNTRTAAVDKLFATWDRTDSPGCALAIIQDGKLIHARGYGMADLEQQVPISTSTLFNIASISKQFTCFVILLLASAGLLSLEDDIRQHLPEVPNFGPKITIRHLMHHTSGLREDGVLLNLAGFRSEDVVRLNDVLELVRRQRELSFAPGAEYMYCNTGYDLLALIVQRVSGRSLREQARERIFQPLGMKASIFCDDYRMLIPRRARPYGPRAGGGFEANHFMHERIGASNLFTSVEELARWDRNFYEPKVGDKDILARMLQKGKLNSGKEISYAAGLRHGAYRGLKYIEHQGATAGYRACFTRFADQGFSVILLANVAPFNAGTLVRRVTDIYLAKQLQPLPTLPENVSVAPKLVQGYAGHYRLPSGEILTFSAAGGQLFVQALLGKTPLRALSDTEFLEEEFETRYTFNHQGVVQSSGGSDLQAERINVVAPSRAELATLAGDYRSPELNVILAIEILGDRALLRQRKGLPALVPLGRDEFRVEGEMPMVLRVQRNALGQVEGFTLGGTRFRHLRFNKVTVREVR